MSGKHNQVLVNIVQYFVTKIKYCSVVFTFAWYIYHVKKSIGIGICSCGLFAFQDKAPLLLMYPGVPQGHELRSFK